jgi:hypothetical protein
MIQLGLCAPVLLGALVVAWVKWREQIGTATLAVGSALLLVLLVVGAFSDRARLQLLSRATEAPAGGEPAHEFRRYLTLSAISVLVLSGVMLALLLWTLARGR